MTFVAVNVDHDEICKWVMRSFADYNSVPLKAREEGTVKYTGGYRLVPSSDQQCHISLGFHHPGGWKADDVLYLRGK